MSFRSSRLWLPTLGGLLLLSAAMPLAAQTGRDLVELRVADGELLTKDGAVYGEALSLPPEFSAVLTTISPGTSRTLLELPLAPGVRRSVQLRRADVYSRDAKIWVQDESGLREVPRTSKVYFLGADPTDPDWRVGLWLDPRSGELGGVTAGPDGEFRLEALGAEHRLVKADFGLPELDAKCANSEAEKVHMPWDPPFWAADLAKPAAVEAKGLATLPEYEAVIAVDTDNEFLSLGFGNDEIDATDWIAELFVSMNVFYERDLGLSLLQGTTILRPSTVPDPWTATGSPANSSQLDEFRDEWFVEAEYADIERVFAMLLSGKSSSPLSASGIAKLTGDGHTPGAGTAAFCSTFSGYSFNQVFYAFSASSSARLVGHEIGHNGGSTHTHCYPTPIDTCFNGQGGCWGGSVACPVGGGTVMSYCNFSPCSSIKSEFHPTVQNVIETNVALTSPGCIEPYSSIFTDDFERGNTTAWSSFVP